MWLCNLRLWILTDGMEFAIASKLQRQAITQEVNASIIVSRYKCYIT